MSALLLAIGYLALGTVLGFLWGCASMAAASKRKGGDGA